MGPHNPSLHPSAPSTSTLRSQRAGAASPAQSAIGKYEIDNAAVYGNYMGDGIPLSPSSRAARSMNRRAIAPMDRAETTQSESPWDMFSNCGGGKCLSISVNDEETGDSREEFDSRDYYATRAIGLPPSPASAHSARFIGTGSRQKLDTDYSNSRYEQSMRIVDRTAQEVNQLVAEARVATPERKAALIREIRNLETSAQYTRALRHLEEPRSHTEISLSI